MFEKMHPNYLLTFLEEAYSRDMKKKILQLLICLLLSSIVFDISLCGSLKIEVD
jgi:hypothetical protein